MPYITKEEVKIKRNLIKKAFPGYKFSVRTVHNSVIDVKVLSGPVDLIPDSSDGYEQINQFYIKEHYKDLPKTSEFLSCLYEIANSSNCIESVDGDYGNIPSFYTHISIGDWDKPYEFKNN